MDFSVKMARARSFGSASKIDFDYLIKDRAELIEALKKITKEASPRSVRAGYKFEGEPTGTIETIAKICCDSLQKVSHKA